MAKELTGVERLNRYVRDATAKKNKKLYPQSIRLACERHKRDLKNKQYFFCEKTANKVISFIEKLPHAKGSLQGKPVKLEDWQCFWIGCLFGWKMKKTGLRRFLKSTVIIPRKNGKSFIAICIALMFFGADQEPGAEVYLGSTNASNAEKQLFAPAKYITEHCHKFRDAYGIEVNAKSLVRYDNNSKLETVIKKPADGDNPHFALVDEYHEHDTAAQYETFETGMAAREQPHLAAVTTAGFDLASPCKMERDDCIAQLEGSAGHADERKFILIYEPDKGDKWDDIKTLRKVNPNIGVSVSEDYLINAMNNAKRSAEKQNAFRTKHCNQWVGAKTVWMDMLRWQKQADKSLKWSSFRGCECYIAVDLASRKDIAAIYCIFVVDGKYFGFPFFYAPEQAAEGNERYQPFVNRGELILTGGAKTDHSVIEDKIREICVFADVQAVGMDQWQADYMMTRLLEDETVDIPVQEFKQNKQEMSEPMKELEASVINGDFVHNGDSCMTWQVGNTAALKDYAEVQRPVKQNKNDDTCKIDGAVAAIMAMGLAMDAENESESIYEKRGLAGA